MYGEIFIIPKNLKVLPSFAKEIFELLNIPSFQERDSSNYKEETYYKADVFGFEIKIYYADEQGLSKDYKYYS